MAFFDPMMVAIEQYPPPIVVLGGGAGQGAPKEIHGMVFRPHISQILMRGVASLQEAMMIDTTAPIMVVREYELLSRANAKLSVDFEILIRGIAAFRSIEDLVCRAYASVSQEHEIEYHGMASISYQGIWLSRSIALQHAKFEWRKHQFKTEGMIEAIDEETDVVKKRLRELEEQITKLKEDGISVLQEIEEKKKKEQRKLDILRKLRRVEEL